MASVDLENLHKTYANGHTALDGIDLSIADGELLVLVGPSGCGKSTLLRLVAGLETPSAGRIRIGEEDVTVRPPQERDVAMVFQSYALYPHKTVRANLAFGLRMRRVPASEVDRRVRAAAAVLGLDAFLDRLPAQLSGGQRQRVALGRAIVREPRVFLLDEPLSNLDAQLRGEMRAELIRLRRRLGTTMLYVTHDQEEAMTLGDRIAVLNEGRVEQAAPPLEVYRRPATLFVARFVGSPAMNLFEARLASEGGRATVVARHFRVAMPTGFGGGVEHVVVGVRPADVEIVAEAEADAVARVDVVEVPGGAALVRGFLGEGAGAEEVLWVAAPEWAGKTGARVGLRFAPSSLHLFEAPSGRRLAEAGPSLISPPVRPVATGAGATARR
jgi:ABC-type sugar transport system ATPase subunit